jgi:hypothetical protein
MRVSLGAAPACTGGPADFLNFSCWGSSVVPPSAPGCDGAGASMTPAMQAACAAQTATNLQALCSANPAACANYQGVTGNDQQGNPTGAGTGWCYLAGLCNADGSLGGASYALLAIAGLLFFEAVRR